MTNREYVCSGCDNLVELGEQYCQECKNDMEQSDWEELQEPDYDCEHNWEYSDDAGGYVCTRCNWLEPDPWLDEDEKRRM